jgi:FdhE protein
MLDEWVRSHPFLQPIARIRARIDAAVERSGSAIVAVPEWTVYAEDFGMGVPLLRSLETMIDLEPAGRRIVAAIDTLAFDTEVDAVVEEARALVRELDGVPEAPPRLVVDWLLGQLDDEQWSPPGAGLLRCAGWAAMSASLRPVLDAFALWRDDDRWLRRYCPSCGSLPAMAQLAGRDPGRRRLLSCGCCGSRWRYGRTGCPFCEKESHRLTGHGIQGEGGLRIDYCEACRAYLKTYDGEGNEPVMLADWTSVHLDVLAQERGLKRLAASLYDFEPTTYHGPPAFRSDSGETEPAVMPGSTVLN